jgi:hypothetical protein
VRNQLPGADQQTFRMRMASRAEDIDMGSNSKYPI